MKVLRWLGYLVSLLIVLAIIESKDEITKTVLIVGGGLGVMLYQIYKRIDENQQQIIKRLEHLFNTVNPRHDD